MTSLGDNWVLKDHTVFHACGPELLHLWTGSRVCECGIVVPQRIRSFHRWLRTQCAQPAGREIARGRSFVGHNPTYRT